ncbi:hypothetical protein RUND412_005256 [Rhizina undulata]
MISSSVRSFLRLSSSAAILRRHTIASPLNSRVAAVPKDCFIGTKSLPAKWKALNWPGNRTIQTSTALRQDGSPEDQSGPSSQVPKKRRKILPFTPYENIWNVPNFLTFSRLLSSPIIGYLVLHDQYAAALGLFAVAGVTDMVDGYIARRWKLQTVVGSVIDPMADKTLMTILTVCLAAKGLMPVWLAGIILGRDVGLAISAIYFRYISLPPPKTFLRYWDFSLPSAEVRPTSISKLNTALQLALVGACTAHPLISGGTDWDIALEAVQYTVATTTVWSGLSYVFSKDAVKILKHPAPSNKDDESAGKQ